MVRNFGLSICTLASVMEGTGALLSCSPLEMSALFLISSKSLLTKWTFNGIWGSPVEIRLLWRATNERLVRASFVRCSKGNSPLCSDTTASLWVCLVLVSSTSPAILLSNQAGAVQEVSSFVTLEFYMMNTDFSKFSCHKICRWREFGFEMSSAGMFVHVDFAVQFEFATNLTFCKLLWGVWPLEAICNLWQDFWVQ